MVDFKGFYIYSKMLSIPILLHKRTRIKTINEEDIGNIKGFHWIFAYLVDSIVALLDDNSE